MGNADATRYLKAWFQEKDAAGGQAAWLAGACWAKASALAGARHAGLEAAWEQEKKDLNLEIAELVSVDKVTGEKDAAVTELTARSGSQQRPTD